MAYISIYSINMTQDEAIELYKDGFSSIEIAEKAGLSSRTIQRAIKEAGITRSASDRFKNAISRGRMVYRKLPLEQRKKRIQVPVKLRWQVLEKFNRRCVACGVSGQHGKLEIDHIDNNPSNNSIDNLQVLCDLCNKGKSQQ